MRLDTYADNVYGNRGLALGVDKVPDICREDIETMWSVNVLSMISMTQHVVSIFKKKPKGPCGDIINIGSIAGRDPFPGGTVYSATKSAVRSFTNALRQEMLAFDIRVLEIDPGQTDTVRHKLHTLLLLRIVPYR